MLTSKQRAYLLSLSTDMDPIFQIGKAGITPQVIEAIDQALEARELIKISVLPTGFETEDRDLKSICDIICSRTHADPVKIIGRRMIIYRPSRKPKIELPKARKAKQ